jgi:hypothetical protein
VWTETGEGAPAAGPLGASSPALSTAAPPTPFALAPHAVRAPHEPAIESKEGGCFGDGESPGQHHHLPCWILVHAHKPLLHTPAHTRRRPIRSSHTMHALSRCSRTRLCRLLEARRTAWKPPPRRIELCRIGVGLLARVNTRRLL